MEPTSSVSPSTIWVTVSVKQAAVPRHCGPVTGGGLPPGGLPPGELPDGLLLGPYEFRTTAATTTIPRRATITTEDPLGIRLIDGTMNHAGLKDPGRPAASG